MHISTVVRTRNHKRDIRLSNESINRYISLEQYVFLLFRQLVEQLPETLRVSVFKIAIKDASILSAILITISCYDFLASVKFSSAISSCHSLQITDVGLISLIQGVPRLRTLLLKGCRSLTDRSLHVLLSHCPVLRRLLVEHCSMSEDAINLFAHLRPTVDVNQIEIMKW